MNRIKNLAAMTLVAVMAVTLASCNEKQQNNGNKPAATTTQAAVEKMTIRFVDEDSIMSNYILAKDINEAMLRWQNKLDAAQTQKGNEINKFMNAMQQKMKTNGYLTEESYNADQAKLQKMQNDAQAYMGKLQQDVQAELAKSQEQLMDSINHFMTEYAKQRGYDMVLRKSATLFIDDRFDITQDVIEGLNKRYNKVAKK